MKQKSVTITRLLCLLVGICLVFSLHLPALARAEGTETVRVGYYENKLFQEGAQEGAVKAGYAYEYYRKLAEYTGWKYDYVYGSFGDLYRMLLDGEIDLLAGLARREDRLGLIGYPEAAMGHESYNLVKREEDTEISADPVTLEGKKIGVMESALVDALHQFLDSHGVEATVITFPDYDSLFASFSVGELDVLAGEGDSGFGAENAVILYSFGASDYYLTVNISRPDLLGQLNTAQTLLAAEEPNYLNSLSAKYYSGSLASRAHSSAEMEWLETHRELKVGYLETYLPYSDTDENGQATGIVTDVTEQLLQSLNIDTLSVSYHGYRNYDDMIADLVAGSIDTGFPVGGGLYYSEESGIYQTNPVVSAATEIVFRGEFKRDAISRFAVNENNRMQYYYVRTHFPDAQITFYPSANACLDAVVAGKEDATTLNGLRANDLLKNTRYESLSLLQLSQSDDRCYGVAMGNEGLLKLLNRGINVLGVDYGQNQAYRYADGLYSYSFLDLVRQHLGIFVLGILAIASVIIFLLLRDNRRSRTQVREIETARIELEDNNRKLEESRKALLENNEIIASAGFGVWHIVLEDGKAPRMRGNDKMTELLGIAGQNLTEEETYDFWYSRINQEAVASVQKSVSEMLEGKLSENTYLWEHPEKGMIYVRCGGTSEALDEHTHHLSGYHSDVTEIVREEQEKQKALSDALIVAEHANRAKTDFLNNMSHDIRTPMNAIIGFTALAASHMDHPEQVKDYLQKITVSSQHLLSLINDVLDMSRIESGKVTIEEANVHLPDVIHDLRTIIQANVTAKQQELLIDTQDVKHEDIISDKLRLNQVLLNILSNAIKFTPAGGTISFRVIEEPSFQADTANFVFRIKDNGIGMSEEFRKTIFEAFTRERTSTVSGTQGTGLGMAITKNIVDMMGGAISVQSEEGKGSEFVVRIPCKIGESETAPAKIPELQGLRALVVDDDTNSCLSVSAMLREIGMRPDWTNYGKEAVIRAKEARDQADEFKVYIIDWMMPDLNGIETVRRIRKIVGDAAPVIILTAYDWTDIEDEAREAGVTAFCPKPVFMSELKSVLAKPFLAEKPAADEIPAAADFTGKRILLAEDNEMNQMIAVAILENTGFTIDIASNGAEAVEKMEQAPAGTYDVILMDIQMPVMDGYEAARRIRRLDDQKKAEIPIVAVTANAFEEDRKIALESGMNGHLAKPYDVSAIMRTLSELLNNR
ncbi:MAG: response regulator [Oscillospiraceae bacterium]|nr:response regulator [Oscillospiraceae bacterium]